MRRTENKLKWISINSSYALEQTGNSKLIQVFVDVFDGDLWSSKASFIGNILLLLIISISSLEVVLSSSPALSPYSHFFNCINIVTSIIFLLETTLRISLSGYSNPAYTGFRGKIRFLFRSDTLIDVISILPFLVMITGLGHSALLQSLKILRSWRLIRYVPAITTISNAFRKKKEEIFVSLLLVILLSLSISTFLYYVERSTGKTGFNDILSALVWSVGKYTGDYGGIAHYEPVTVAGQVLATINGLLGIALFALPAGLLGSAFIDELAERKEKNELEHRNKRIIKQIGKDRFATFDSIQAKLLYSEEEIIKTIRESKNLRFRAMKSSPDILFNDIKVIESFIANTPYGYRSAGTLPGVTIIMPIGNVERGISHFCRNVAEKTGAGLLAKEYTLITKKEKTIDGFHSMFYADAGFRKNKKILPDSFTAWRSDIISATNESKWIVLFISAGSGRQHDFHFTYGNKEGATDGQFSNSTIVDYQLFETLYGLARMYSGETVIQKKNKAPGSYGFSIAQHERIGTTSGDELPFFIKACDSTVNVLTIYVNINLLTQDEDRYNAGITFISRVITEGLQTIGS